MAVICISKLHVSESPERVITLRRGHLPGFNYENAPRCGCSREVAGFLAWCWPSFLYGISFTLYQTLEFHSCSLRLSVPFIKVVLLSSVFRLLRCPWTVVRQASSSVEFFQQARANSQGNSKVSITVVESSNRQSNQPKQIPLTQIWLARNKLLKETSSSTSNYTEAHESYLPDFLFEFNSLSITDRRKKKQQITGALISLLTGGQFKYLAWLKY